MPSSKAAVATFGNKVPDVALAFWAIKILSTTVGETGADFLAVGVGWGQGTTAAIMVAVLVGTMVLQLRTPRYTPWIYWLTVVLVSVVGTQITDALTDRLGVSLYASTAFFSLALVAILALWFRTEHDLSIRTIVTRRREMFYWATVLCTFALGTAAGDLATEALGLGFTWGATVFAALLAFTWLAWRRGAGLVPSFWLAYILTRPFGAALGDLLSQAKTYGGLGLGAAWTSVMFLSVIVLLVTVAQIRTSREVSTSSAS